MTDTSLQQLIINELTKAQYEALTPASNQLYMVTDEVPLDSSDVINNVTSTTTDKPLSANMGKELQDEINNLKNIGRFLAIWSCATGLPLTNPTTLPYTYKTGDYFRVGTVDSTTNYKPDGSQYTGSASTTVETSSVSVGSVYYYDGTQWLVQAAGGGGTVQDVQVDGTSVVGSGTGIANITLSNFSITATATELNYTDGVTSNIQTQLNNKQNTLTADNGIILNSTASTIGISQGGFNCTIVGGTLNGTIWTGETNAYIDLPEIFDLSNYDSWEFKTKLVLGSSVGTGCIIGYAGSTLNDCKFPVLQFNSTGGLVVYASSNGTTWDIFSNVSVKTFSFNTTYWIKFGYNSTSGYYFQSSTDGESYVSDWTSAITTKTKASVRNELLSAAGGHYSLAADIDLAETSWTGDSNTIWELEASSSSVAKATTALYGLVKPDNSTITISDGVITASSLYGLTATTAELNTLAGTTEYTASEVQTLWDSVS